MFALLLTCTVATSGLRQNCASLLTPGECNGKPSSQGSDYVCAWNVRSNTPSCTAVESEEFNLCALYNGNPAACSAQPTCFYDQEDMECEVREPGEQEEGHHHIMPVQPMNPPMNPPSVPTQPQPVTPHSPPHSGTSTGTQPSSPTQPASKVPATPVQPFQPTTPSTPSGPTQPTTPGVQGPPPAQHTTPNTPPAQPTTPVTPVQPITPPQPSRPKNCNLLSQTECFGPSSIHGELCMWDAEDFECSSVLEGDAEAICKQFAGDMQKCDAQLDCFWDTKDRECNEIKQGAGEHMVVRTTCATLTTETACAGTASCFWDDQLCVNVVQAVNVCQVYTTPKLCSTNALCHWQGSCMFATNQFHLNKAHVGSLFVPQQMGAPATGYQPVPGAAPQFAPAGQQMAPQQPAYPGQTPVAPQQPGMQPGMVPQQPMTPGMTPQQPGAYPGTPAAQPQPGAYPAQPAAPIPPAPVQPANNNYPPNAMNPQFCKMLSKQECFGPSLQPGEYCMWDAEDFECSSFSEHDAEGLCKQYGLNPQQCDAQMDCFWDEKDHECSDVKGIIPFRGSHGASIRTTCMNYKTVETCAAQASCFWEQSQTQSTCVNVIQAVNVCRVLTTAVACSTNILCTWQGSTCDLATGHWLTQVNSAKTSDTKHSTHMKHTKTESSKSSSTKISFFPSVVMVILGFSVGVLATLGCRKKKETDFQTPLDMDYVQQTDGCDRYA